MPVDLAGHEQKCQDAVKSFWKRRLARIFHKKRGQALSNPL